MEDNRGGGRLVPSNEYASADIYLLLVFNTKATGYRGRVSSTYSAGVEAGLYSGLPKLLPLVGTMCFVGCGSKQCDGFLVLIFSRTETRSAAACADHSSSTTFQLQQL